MSVDLSGLKVGSAWRVETSWMNGTLFIYSIGYTTKYVVYYNGGGADSCDATGLTSGGIYRITKILHELKAPSDITAADLDGRVIETADGGAVVFAGESGFVVDSIGYFSTTLDEHKRPSWYSDRGHLTDMKTTAAEIVSDYQHELERRRNPVEIVWQGECRDDDGTLLSAWCEVRGEKWRLSRPNIGGYCVYRKLMQVATRESVADAEQYIRDYYASKDSK